MKKKKLWLLVIFGYLVLTVIFTYPLISNFATAFPSDGGDAVQYLWNLWWTKYAVVNLKTSPFFSNYIYYPWGTSLLYNTFTPLRNFVSIPLQMIFGLIAANNILIFASFIFSGFFMFLLAYELTKHRFASFMAGFSYAFSPYVFAHLRGHYNFTSIELFPLLLLVLIKLWQKPNIKKAFFLGLILIGLLLTDYFYLFCGLLLVLIFIFFHLGHKNKIGNFLSYLFLSGAVLGIILLPLVVLLYYKSYLGNEFYRLGSDRYLTDLASFFIPHCTGLFWRSFFEKVNFPMNAACGFDGSFTEGIVYLGFLPLLSVFMIFRRKKFLSTWQKFAFFGGVISMILALGDKLQFLGWATGVKLPYYLFSLIPFLRDFRVPSRIAVLTTLFFSLVLAFEFKEWLLKIKLRWKIILWSGIIFLVGLVDLLSTPILIEKRLAPDFYRQLRNKKKVTAILDIPLGFWEDPGRSIYYQTVHQKPILGGLVSRLPRKPVELYRGYSLIRAVIDFQNKLYLDLDSEQKIVNVELNDFLSPENSGLFRDQLAELDIDYLILHNEFFEENKLEGLLFQLMDFFEVDLGLDLIYGDDKITVYQ